MLKSNHILWTLGISPWIFNFLNYELSIIIILSIITSLMSSLPDIDQKIVRYFKKLNFKTLYLTYPIYIIVKLIFKHRTITHSLFIPIAILISVNLLQYNIYLEYFLISVSSALILHIFEDCMTIAGVKIFWPIPIKVKLANFRTASNWDNTVLHIIGLLILLSFPFYYFRLLELIKF
ncbi:MAG: metal-dependent hydrolase [Nanoarchaeales archaeon]|nr:metal-dependent hydrolase [Nanoarchaeales archaeon]